MNDGARQRGHIIHSRLAALVSADPAARKRVRALRRALAGATRCTFLVQNDPDPDAIASALALRRTLGFSAARSPIVTAGQITRPENQRLIAELHERVRHVSNERLPLLAPLVLVDVQPPYFGDGLAERRRGDRSPSHDGLVSRALPRCAHELRRERDDGGRVSARGGCGRRDDAGSRRRCSTASSRTPSRSRARRAMKTCRCSRSSSRGPITSRCRRIQHPMYRPLALGASALRSSTRACATGSRIVHLGLLPADQEHIVAQLAEFCLGMAGAEISAVSGVFAREVRDEPALALAEREARRANSQALQRIRKRGRASDDGEDRRAAAGLEEGAPVHEPGSARPQIRRELVKALTESK